MYWFEDRWEVTVYIKLPCQQNITGISIYIPPVPCRNIFDTLTSAVDMFKVTSQIWYSPTTAYVFCYNYFSLSHFEGHNLDRRLSFLGIVGTLHVTTMIPSFPHCLRPHDRKGSKPSYHSLQPFCKCSFSLFHTKQRKIWCREGSMFALSSHLLSSPSSMQRNLSRTLAPFLNGFERLRFEELELVFLFRCYPETFSPPWSAPDW